MASVPLDFFNVIVPLRRASFAANSIAERCLAERPIGIAADESE